MQITVLQENLLSAVNKAVRLVEGKSTLPILTNLLFKAEKNALRVISSNLENTLCVQLGAQVEKSGQAAISAQTLTSYLALLPPGKLILAQDKNQLKVQGDSQQASFPTQNPEDFPALPELSSDVLCWIDPQEFKQAVQRTCFAAAAETGRPALTGLFWQIKEGGSSSLVGTDGFRLAEAQLTLQQKNKKEAKPNFILPVRGLVEIERLLDKSDELVQVTTSNDNNQVAFKLPQITLYSRLIEAEYPQYEKIIPAQFQTQVEVAIEAFLPAIKQVALFAGKDGQTIQLKILAEKDRIKLVSRSAELGGAESVVAARIEGQSVTQGFNARFLTEALSHFGSKQVKMSIKEAVAPTLLTSPDEPGYQQVIMPVRLDNSTQP